MLPAEQLYGSERQRTNRTTLRSPFMPVLIQCLGCCWTMPASPWCYCKDHKWYTACTTSFTGWPLVPTALLSHHLFLHNARGFTDIPKGLIKAKSLETELRTLWRFVHVAQTCSEQDLWVPKQHFQELSQLQGGKRVKALSDPVLYLLQHATTRWILHCSYFS